jgi:flagellar basal body-associated protein FliL
MAKILNIYVHDDNQENLKSVCNQSALINDLLRQYFKSTSFKTMSPEQLKLAIQKEKLKRDYELKLKELHG